MSSRMQKNRARSAPVSAGLVLYRLAKDGPEVLLVHPGGPFWKSRDLGAWSIPKGLMEENEPPLDAALREFAEETGHPPPPGPYHLLPEVRLRSGKRIIAFAAEGDLDASTVRSNTFTMEWPPHSGRMQEFPEIDRAAWFPLAEAKRRINPGMVPLLDALRAILEKQQQG